MCIAIALDSKNNLKNNEITKTIFKRCWLSNPDGGGYAYVNNGEVIIDKGYMKLKPFEIAFFNAREAYPDSRFLLHFRIASKGTVDADNCHPFFIHNGKSAIIHNGTITDLGSYNSGKSDTAILAEMLGKLPEMWYKDKLYCKLLDTAISGYNKFAILTKENKVFLLHKYGFEHEKGIYFSNKDYMPSNREPWNNGNKKSNHFMLVGSDPKVQNDYLVRTIKDGVVRPRGTYTHHGKSLCMGQGCTEELTLDMEKKYNLCSLCLQEEYFNKTDGIEAQKCSICNLELQEFEKREYNGLCCGCSGGYPYKYKDVYYQGD